MGALAAAFLLSVLAVQAAELHLSPRVIEMGALYRDVAVRIEGIAEPDAQVVVVLRGAAAKESFNKKGRVGPIWLNVGKVEISGVPSLFLSFASAPVQSLLQREELDRYQLDEIALRRQMRVEPAAFDQPEVRRDYWALKAEQGSFRVHPGAVEPLSGGRFRVQFVWPRKAPPGVYTVTAYWCREGRVAGQTTATLTVKRVGLPAIVADLAQNQAPKYAVLAVLAAMLAGFGIDQVVSRLGGKRRRARVAHGVAEAAEQESRAGASRGGH